jgi:hypothetical protein
MSQDSYIYSTYGLASALLLFGLKKLHESQCIMRNGTIQIKLSNVLSSSRHLQKRHTNAHQKAPEKAVDNEREESSPVDIVIDDCACDLSECKETA